MHTKNQISLTRKSLYGIMVLTIFLASVGTGNLPTVRAQEARTNTSTSTERSIPASIPSLDTPIPNATDLAMATPEEATFTLDGVSVSIRSTFLPSTDFIVSEPGAASQVATAVTWEPFQEFTVTAIPFGYKSGTEILPVASLGGKEEYDNIIRSYRVQQGGRVQEGSTITLFGHQVTGLYSLIEIPFDGPTPKPVAIEEWTVEAGNRLWIVRVSEEQPANDFTTGPRNFIEDLTLISETLNNPSTLYNNDNNTSSSAIAPIIKLSTPSWWHGDCDYDTYYQGSGGRGSYRLGAVYQDMPACGPRPYSDNAPDVLVNFFPGSWGVYEWECVELSKRFLYLMYGINPYQANGSQVVWNYSGTRLVKVSNGTVGKAPQPNDVLSYGSTSTFGHTSIVTSTNVDGNGNGTITVIEENYSASGSNTMSVANWSVLGNAGSVSGWLHDNGSSCYTLTRNHNGNGSDPTASPSNSSGCSSGQYKSGESINLTAYPASGYHLGSWSGTDSSSSNHLTMPSNNHTVTANYVQDSGSCDATSVPSGYSKCADEGGRCNFSGSKSVYYGANTCYEVRTFSDGVDCNNNNFGDPVPGTQKACYIESSTGNWNASFYDNHDRWWDNNNNGNLKCTENFSSTYLDKNYGTGAPCGGMDGDIWVGDYTGTINFPSGNYVFRVEHDDGLKLWLNGSNIADRGDSGADWVCPARSLSGNNTLRVMLREDGGDAKVKVSWTTDTSVCNPPPGSFNKSSPANGVTDQSTSVTLQWGASSNVSSYEYCYDTSNDNACSNWTNNGTSTSKSLSLSQNTTYYWHVRAVNGIGTTYSNDSSTAFWSFTTQGGGTGIGCGEVSYNGVILYEQKNCNRDTGGVTKAFSSPTEWIDIVSDPIHDKTSSIYVANGWSIKVFEASKNHFFNGAYGGSWRCITGSMWDLSVNYYTNLNTNQIIDDTISSLQVFSNTSCTPSIYTPVDILYNGGFEEGDTLPDLWYENAWQMDRSTFTWDSMQKHSGNKSVKISNNTSNDARWVQAVDVQVNSDYRLSGWIKTENIAQNGDRGANLSYGTFQSTEPKLDGTNDWTFVSVQFNTGSNTQITISARLGMDSGDITGTAWFDDIKLELLSSPVCYSLTTTSDPVEGGTVTVNPPPNCNSGNRYVHGTTVKITAVPNPNYLFLCWDECFFYNEPSTMFFSWEGDQTKTANFRYKNQSVYHSTGIQDGWILETSETSNNGGTLDSAATTLRLGDDAARKQYRSVLSFATGASLPDTAVITKVTLKVKRQGVIGGGNPVTTFQGFMVDIKKGFFGTTALQTTDFQAAAHKTYGPFMTALSGGWYSIDLTPGKGYINKLSSLSGLTQIRLRFKLDDNNNAVANVLSLYSGNAGAASRPQLIIEYYVP